MILTAYIPKDAGRYFSQVFVRAKGGEGERVPQARTEVPLLPLPFPGQDRVPLSPLPYFAWTGYPSLPLLIPPPSKHKAVID